jgi:hypothetical protein
MKSYAAAVVIVLCCSSASAQNEVKAKVPPQTRALVAQPSSNGDGRFVFGQINDARADQYMLDTKTGRLWRVVLRADGKGDMLQVVPYGSDDGTSFVLAPAQ